MSLKRSIGQLPEWNAEEGDQYRNVSRMYTQLTGQYNRYLGHVANNIGGRFVTYRSIEQPGPVYEAVPKDRQKAALNFLNENLFQKPTWLIDVPYMYNMTDSPDTYLYSLVNGVVSAGNLLNIQKLDRLGQFAQNDPANYSPEEYLSDLTGMVFSELYKGKATDSYRRYLQRRFVSAAIEAMNGRGAENSDGKALILGTLTEIQKKAAKAKSSDTVTQAHWQEIAKTIEKALK